MMLRLYQEYLDKAEAPTISMHRLDEAFTLKYEVI